MDCSCWKMHDTYISVECSNATRIDNNYQPVKSQRLIDFEIKNSHTEVFYNEFDEQITLTGWHDPIIKGCKVIEASDLTSLQDTIHSLNDLFSSKGLNSCCIKKICEELCSMSSSNKYCTFLLSVKTHSVNVICEGCMVNRALDESSADDAFLPACEPSIKELLKNSTKVEKNCESGNCVICLEEFHADEDTVVMPCSHVFHEECIDKWLHVSHYCPLCRYELPTATTQSD